jgi:uncharacterized protein YktB (UPF0637 family)
MFYHIQTTSTGFDSAGYTKKTHVITFNEILDLSTLKFTLSLVDDVVKNELYVEKEYSQHDCTGRYSTSEIKRVHRSFDHGTLLVIYNEFGSYDI